jgi:hypothetical protein
MSSEVTPVSVESIVESVRLSHRRSGLYCHSREYRISWTEPDGQEAHKSQLLCSVCDDPVRWMAFGDPRREVGGLSVNRPLVDAWIPTQGRDAVAVAYILLVADKDHSVGFRIEGRLGIRSQWRDFRAGNIPTAHEPWRSFSERFYGLEGPGVYPVPVHNEDEACP